MCSNQNQTRKYYGKPTQRKMCTREVLQKIPDYAKYLSALGEMGFVSSIATIKVKL